MTPWLRDNAATLAVLISIVSGAVWFGQKVGSIETHVETLNASVSTINSNLGELTEGVNQNSVAIATLRNPSGIASVVDNDLLSGELEAMRADLMDIKEYLRNQD